MRPFQRMSILMYGVLFLVSFKIQSSNVGLCIMATGRYAALAQQLISSARTYFCRHHTVTYFVFTDGTIAQADDIKTIYQEKLGWPFDTLLRFEVYLKNRAALEDMDYVFATDADMLFVADVGDEILSDRVATVHPGFVGNCGTPERNSISQAYIAQGVPNSYFAGGFYGGTRDAFFHLIERCAANIRIDLEKKYVAIWHDESHLNRYFVDFPPTKILSPDYCWPEQYMRASRKLLALYKNHAQMRK